MNLSQAQKHIDLFYGPPLQVVSDCLRGFLVARPGHDLIGGDWSAIEARIVRWLAGDDLGVFLTHGKVYEEEAANIFGISMDQVDSHQRFIGKVATLAFGFGGGYRAFQVMAKNYGLQVTDEQADSFKEAWRRAHLPIVDYWRELEYKMKAAIRTRNESFTAGPAGRRVTFKVNGSFLWCRLPSGRVLCYPYPKLKMRPTPWFENREVIVYMAQNSLTRKWEETTAYGGLICENITQAVARDILVDAMHRIDPMYPIVMHAHDEIISEINKNRGSVEHFTSLMAEPPTWAKDLPLTAAGWRGKRYRK